MGVFGRLLLKGFIRKELVLPVNDSDFDHADAAYLEGSRGCGWPNVTAQLPAGTSGREPVREHAEQAEMPLRAGLASDLADERARGFAEQLSFLLDGAGMRSELEGSNKRLIRAKEIVLSLEDTR